MSDHRRLLRIRHDAPTSRPGVSRVAPRSVIVLSGRIAVVVGLALISSACGQIIGVSNETPGATPPRDAAAVWVDAAASDSGPAAAPCLNPGMLPCVLGDGSATMLGSCCLVK